MEIKRIQIEGENIPKLHDLIIKKWDLDYSYKDGHTYVYMYEEYHPLLDSNLLSVFIVKYVGDSKCKIKIITGGGKWSDGWGAENKKIIKEFIEISDGNSWTINGLSQDEYRKYQRKNFTNKVGELWKNR